MIFLFLACGHKDVILPSDPAPIPDLPAAAIHAPLPGPDPGAEVTAEQQSRFDWGEAKP